MSFQYYDLIKVLFLNDAMPVCELQWVTTQAKRNVCDMFRWRMCAWLLGALSKEVRRRKCSNCLTPTITKQSNLIPWSSYLHLCVVSTCLPPLNIWWCLQLSPNISNVFQSFSLPCRLAPVQSASQFLLEWNMIINDWSDLNISTLQAVLCLRES